MAIDILPPTRAPTPVMGEAPRIRWSYYHRLQCFVVVMPPAIDDGGDPPSVSCRGRPIPLRATLGQAKSGNLRQIVFLNVMIRLLVSF